VSLRQGVYWVGHFFDNAVYKHNLTTGNVLTVIPPSFPVESMAVTADRKFLLVASEFASPLKTINTHTDAVVGVGTRDAMSVSVCDDGTVISADMGGLGVATYTIDGTGNLAELAAASNDAGPIINIACSPGSAFFVALIPGYGAVRSFAVTSLTGTTVGSLSLSVSAYFLSVVFNPATADVYLLDDDGVLSVYAFDTMTGMFGTRQSSVNTGGSYIHYAGVNSMQFAYGKLFVHAADQLLTYDAALNEVSSATIVAGAKTALCVSDGTTCCVID
jgi:WD40 repeat protein